MTIENNATRVYKELMINTAFQTVTHIFFVILNITYWIRVSERSEIETAIDEETFTLSHLRRIFLNPEFHIEEFYSIILSISFLIAVVGPQNPIIYPYVTVGMIVYYWALKRHFI